MTVLGRDKIAERLDAGNLVISPILDRDQIGEISVDVRVGTVALVVRGSGISHVDPRAYLQSESLGGAQGEQDRRQKFERFDIPIHESFILHPGMLALVPTLEWFKLPKDLKGVVTARSSWAREGLNIATATFIDPNYIGIITLELSNVGQVPIAVYPGMRIAQIAFNEVQIVEPPIVPLNKQRQFTMSFEPHAGFVTRGDEAFIPKK